MNAPSPVISNRQGLHIHCAQSMASASSVPSRGFKLAPYSERALLFARTGDLVYVHTLPDPKYVAYLNELGIGPRKADVIACPDTPETAGWPLVKKIAEDECLWWELVQRLRAADEVVLQPYMTTRFESEFVRRLRHRLPGTVQLIGGDSAVLEHFDQKHWARATAVALGIPVAPGEVLEITKAADWFGLGSAIRRQLSHTGKVIVRGALGSNGSSVQVVSSNDEVTPCIERLQSADANRLFLVEAMFEVTSSPNVGIFIDPWTRDISCFSCTEQVFGKGLAHAGNQYPPKDSEQLPAMIAAAERFAFYLRNQGITGHLGFDFCEYKSQAGKSAFLLAELNPRINGATYSQTLFAALNRAQQIHGGPSLNAFHAVKMCTSHRSFAELENAVGKLLFRPGQEKGIVPVGLGSLIEGKCGIVMLANQTEALEELHQQMAAKLQPTVMQRAA